MWSRTEMIDSLFRAMILCVFHSIFCSYVINISAFWKSCNFLYSVISTVDICSSDDI